MQCAAVFPTSRQAACTGRSASYHPHPNPARPSLPALLPCSSLQLTDAHIAALPIPRLQKNGLLFVWVRGQSG